MIRPRSRSIWPSLDCASSELLADAYRSLEPFDEAHAEATLAPGRGRGRVEGRPADPRDAHRADRSSRQPRAVRDAGVDWTGTIGGQAGSAGEVPGRARREARGGRLDMRIPISAWIVAVVMLAACDRPASNGAGTPPAGTPELALSPTPPADIPPNASQADAVLYAWQSFVALNWPALSGQRGVPDPAKVIGQPGGVVWHTWKTPDEIFYPDGQTPPPWNQYRRPAAAAVRLRRCHEQQFRAPAHVESAGRYQQCGDPGRQGSGRRDPDRSARQSRALRSPAQSGDVQRDCRPEGTTPCRRKTTPPKSRSLPA